MTRNVLAGEVGKELRAFRVAHGLRQDDVARAARQSGLPWTRSVVVALEAGRRDLSIDDFVRLPEILVRLGVATEELEVRIESKGGVAQMRVAHLQTRQDLGTPWADTLAGTERVERAMQAAFPWTRGQAELRPAYEAAGGDLEQKVGRRQRLDPLVVALVAQATWGRPLTEERDRRVAELAPPATSPRAMQALRGHVSRALLEELTPRLTEAHQRLRKKKGGRR